MYKVKTGLSVKRTTWPTKYNMFNHTQTSEKKGEMAGFSLPIGKDFEYCST